MPRFTEHGDLQMAIGKSTRRFTILTNLQNLLTVIHRMWFYRSNKPYLTMLANSIKTYIQMVF